MKKAKKVQFDYSDCQNLVDMIILTGQLGMNLTPVIELVKTSIEKFNKPLCSNCCDQSASKCKVIRAVSLVIKNEQVRDEIEKRFTEKLINPN